MDRIGVMAIRGCMEIRRTFLLLEAKFQLNDIDAIKEESLRPEIIDVFSVSI